MVSLLLKVIKLKEWLFFIVNYVKNKRKIEELKGVGLERKLQLYYSKLVEKLSKNGQ